MPAITIRFAESAVADLEEIKRWYAEQDVPGVADRLISEIFERVGTLRDHLFGYGRHLLRAASHRLFRARV